MLPQVIIDGQVATKALTEGPASVVVEVASEDVARGGVAVAEEGVVASGQACGPKQVAYAMRQLMGGTSCVSTRHIQAIYTSRDKIISSRHAWSDSGGPICG
jgi:hypothetical protein